MQAAICEGLYLRKTEQFNQNLESYSQMAQTVESWSQLTSLKYRWILSMGPGKLKSKPNRIRISYSRATRSCFDMFFFSDSLRRLIILEKEGCIGYSNLAAKRIEIVDNVTIYWSGQFQCPINCRYLSKMLHAINSVSILYPFSWCRCMIFWIPAALPL